MSPNDKIAVIPGDATGPEVVTEAITVFDDAGKMGCSTGKVGDLVIENL